MTSLTNQIRDAIFTRLVPIATWASTPRKTPFPTLQTNQVPALGVFLLRENYTPDGDSNVGPPRYQCDATISIAIVDLASSPNVLDGTVDALIDLAQQTILTDSTFLRMTAIGFAGVRLIDSIPSMTRTYQFPNSGETYYLECRLTMVFRYFCFFEPVAPNMLTDVSIHTAPIDPIKGISTLDIPLGT